MRVQWLGSGEGAPTGPFLASVTLAMTSGHRASLPGGCQATLGQDICCPTTTQSLGAQAEGLWQTRRINKAPDTPKSLAVLVGAYLCLLNESMT